MDLVDPDALLADAPRVREALDAAGWSAAALDDLLGATHRQHLDRDELAPVLRRTQDGSPLSVLARLLVAGVPVDLDEATRAGLPESWLRPEGYDVVSPVRLQPVRHDGVEVLVPHDPGRAASGVARDQVLGVGDDENLGVRAVIAVLAIAGIVAAVTVSNKRSVTGAVEIAAAANAPVAR